MPKTTATKITKTVADAAKPEEKPYFVWDSEVKGFGLAVYPPSPRYPSGVKTYVVRYFTQGGRDRRMKVGRHGAITTEQARALAKRAFHEVAEGKDPLEERREAREKERSALTVEQLFERYEREHLSKKKPKTRQEVRRIFEKEILPKLGRRRAEDVSKRDAKRLHGEFSDRPYMGNRVIAWLCGLMTFAEAEEVEQRPKGSNPCANWKQWRYTEFKRKRYLSLEELGRLGDALEKLGGGSPEASVYADAVRLGVLTGGRKSEILGLRREWIDTEHRWIAYPDTKGGEVVHALGPAAIEILESLPNESEWVFPSPKDPNKHRTNIHSFLVAVFEEAEIENASFHTFRRTKATIAHNDLNYSELMIAEMLGQGRKTVTAGYIQLDTALRTADERVQSFLHAALTRQPEAKVIPFAREAG